MFAGRANFFGSNGFHEDYQGRVSPAAEKFTGIFPELTRI